MTLRILIADDEPLARARLRALVEELGHEVCAEAGDGHSAKRFAAEAEPDLILLDIEMPGVDGMALARQLEKEQPDLPVVMVTAHPQHAVDAFDTAVTDYLLKPVRKDRLARALDRVASRPAATTPVQKSIRVDLGRRVRLVPLVEIDCFVAEGGYVIARSANLEGFVDATLDELENTLGITVLRANRSCLVVRAAVSGIENSASGKYRLLLRGGSQAIRISRRRVAAVKQIISASVIEHGG